MSGCKICLSDRHKVKFVSPRIEICQRCVSLIQGKPIDFDKIENALFDIAISHTTKPPQKPEPSSLRIKAEEIAKSKETLIDAAVNLLFTTSRRTSKIEEELAKLTSAEETSYKIALRNYEDSIGVERIVIFKKIISGEFAPKYYETIYARGNYWGTGYRSRTRTVQKDAFAVDTKNSIKLMRAIMFGLHSGKEKSHRMEEDEFHPIRDSIFKEDGYKCAICRRTRRDNVELHAHHIIPLDDFGSNHPNNLITLCHSCHNKQHKGFKVKRIFPRKRSPTVSKIVTVDAEATDFDRKKSKGLDKGVRQKFTDAVKRCMKPNERGKGIAQHDLAVMYANGQGIPQDYVKAVTWHKKAAGKGNVNAQYCLGKMCRDGKGTPQNFAEAAKWYHMAAEQGYAPAQEALGGMYDFELGVPQDRAEAAKWYRKAAEQGNADAQSNLGYMYYHGEGVLRDWVESAKWWRKSAEQGHAYAQRRLSVMYEYGWGVPVDNVEALKWLELSASCSTIKNDRDIAIKDRDILAAKMALAQVVEAQKRASEWKPKK
jgi:hypothetical protein